MNTKLFFLLVLLFTCSCKEEDTCYNLNSEELSFFHVYALNDEFKLKYEVTGDIFTFNVNEKNIDLIEPPSNGWNSFSGFESSTGDTLVEVAETTYLDGSGAIGHIVIKPSSYYESQSLSISIYNLLPNIIDDLYFTKDSSTLIGSSTINGINYDNVYLFDSYQYQLYFSTTSGFLRVDENDNSGTYTYTPILTVIN